MPGRDYYIELIENSPFFSIDPQSSPGLYSIEKDRLVENIFLYKVAESRENENYGYEIMETFCSCVKFYSPDKGSFLHYFNSAFKLQKTKSEAEKTLSDSSGGIHFTAGEKRTLKVIHNFLKTHSNISKETILSCLDEYADTFGMEPGELKSAIKAYEDSISVSGDADVTSDEEGFTLFDMISSNNDFTEDIDAREELLGAFDRCEEGYLKARDKTKKLISVKLTATIAQASVPEEYLGVLRQKSFFNSELYQRLSAADIKMTNKEISRFLNISEANLTQIWKRYIKQVQQC